MIENKPNQRKNFTIAVLEEKYLEPIKPEFQRYNGDDTFLLSSIFKSHEFKNFIFKELESRNVINYFVEQIFKILKDFH